MEITEDVKINNDEEDIEFICNDEDFQEKRNSIPLISADNIIEESKEEDKDSIEQRLSLISIRLNDISIDVQMLRKHQELNHQIILGALCDFKKSSIENEEDNQSTINKLVKYNKELLNLCVSLIQKLKER